MFAICAVVAHQHHLPTQRALRQSGVNPSKIRHQIKVSVSKTTHNIDTSGLPRDAQRVLNCISHANGDVDKIQSCQQ